MVFRRYQNKPRITQNILLASENPFFQEATTLNLLACKALGAKGHHLLCLLLGTCSATCFARKAFTGCRAKSNILLGTLCFIVYVLFSKKQSNLFVLLLGAKGLLCLLLGTCSATEGKAFTITYHSKKLACCKTSYGLPFIFYFSFLVFRPKNGQSVLLCCKLYPVNFIHMPLVQ